MKNASGEQFRSLYLELERQRPENFLDRHVKRTADGVAVEASDRRAALRLIFLYLFVGVCIAAGGLLIARLALAEMSFKYADLLLLELAIIGLPLSAVPLGVVLIGHYAFIAKAPLSTEWNNTSRTVRYSCMRGLRHSELVIRYDDVLGFDLRSLEVDIETSHHLYMAIRFGASVEETSQWIWSGATPRHRQFIVSPSGLWKSVFEARFLIPDQPRNHAEFEVAGTSTLEDLERARDVLVEATGLPALHSRIANENR